MNTCLLNWQMPDFGGIGVQQTNSFSVLYLQVPKPNQGNMSSSPVVEEPSSENKLEQEFHLVRTLLSLSHSEVSNTHSY